MAKAINPTAKSLKRCGGEERKKERKEKKSYRGAGAGARNSEAALAAGNFTASV